MSGKLSSWKNKSRRCSRMEIPGKSPGLTRPVAAEASFFAGAGSGAAEHAKGLTASRNLPPTRSFAPYLNSPDEMGGKMT